MSRIARPLVPALAIVLALAAAACGGPGDAVTPAPLGAAGAARPVLRAKVGVVLPLSGADAALGKEASLGVELAREAFEEATGAKVELLVRDDGFLPQGATRETEAVAEAGADAVVGELGSSRTALVAAAAEAKNIPLVIPLATAPGLVEGRAWVVRIVPDDEQQGEAAAALVEPRTKVAIAYHPSSAWSKSVVEGFAKGMAERGGSIEHFAAVAPGDADLGTTAERIDGEKARLVFAALFAPDVAALSGALARRGSFALVGGDALDTDEVASHPRELEGVRYVGHFAADAPWPEARRLVALHARRAPGSPSSIEALAYDATLVALEAVGRAGGGSRGAVRAELGKTRGRAGASGTLAFGPAGRVLKEMPVLELRRDGERLRPVFHGVVKTR